ncbi:MAG: YidC/Oxa1 family membrane protein insertase [Clostridia bacterium]|nr:YidC/Oxa1 family membrane protein insertase [Clostridia bacterium]
MDTILTPFVWLLKQLCEFFQSYPVAIFVFTLIVNMALIPFNIKQQKNMAKQARLRPKLEALKEKFGEDRMKYQSAMQELYQKENISPTGGCLPMIIRMVILMMVFYSVNMIIYGSATRGAKIASQIDVSYFNLFGLDLSQTPHFSTDVINAFNSTWLIPIICFLAQMLSMFISNRQQAKNNPQMASQGGSMKIMMFTMPVISLIFTFQVTCATGFYWICSSVVNTVILLIVNHFYSADKILAKEMIEEGISRRQKEQKIIDSQN